ncbi:MAG: aminotransferase class III-fold pyridoxal phosphate-dependent enzyme [Robiginitomaculum sp.]|nr:aminotransferase class III-fold pyridoxal phosphate-dependent enzyme [Robiginitomaculum sp.]
MNTYWQKVVGAAWGIDITLSKLGGEYDLNFLGRGSTNCIVKVMRPNCIASFVDMQCRAIMHIREYAPSVPVPEILKTLAGQNYSIIPDQEGHDRIVWVLEELDGKVYADFVRKSDDLICQIGQAVGQIDIALKSFQHPKLERQFKWDLCEALWIAENVSVVEDPTRHAILDEIITDYRAIKPVLDQLPKQAIHNDINDYNILANGGLYSAPKLSGIIDLGDMCFGPRICDLTIACAYIVLGHNNPIKALTALISGYHAENPLTASEIDMIWPLLRMRLAVSVVNSTLMSKDNPADPYILISQKPAWGFLEDENMQLPFLKDLINARLRVVCGLPLTDTAKSTLDWIDQQRGHFSPILGQDMTNAPMINASVETSIPLNPNAIQKYEATLFGSTSESPSLGYYGEPRLVYTDAAFFQSDWKAGNRRTIHLGIDVFIQAGTDVCAPLQAKVISVETRAGNLDYGGVVILQHETPEGHTFFTLYGHLDPASFQHLNIGGQLKFGQKIANIGTSNQNGGWSPHLHLQMALTLGGIEQDWPGAADPDDFYLWREIFPNPAALLNLPNSKTTYTPPVRADILKKRKSDFSANLSLSYDEPAMFLRGWKHYLFDEWGRPFLDSYNNVPHVGHSHPRIQAVASEQLKLINTNTRYLHPAQNAFAEKILSKLPKSLSVCFFVNSGTEANELALRLSRAHTGGKDMIVPDHGYHGNTTGAIDISAYKFNAEGGPGKVDWVHLVDVADTYRGQFREDDPDCAQKYAALIDDVLIAIEARGGKLAGFIAETFPSVGGQIIPPDGYLKDVYKRIRAAGGVCIADEVQTGLGRLGDYYFGFEQQKVVPDIVVLGKPIGNGHPIGVLVTTREIANSFAQGPEFFSTFGGSTLSCLIGKEVLDIVDDENLMQNAKRMGDILLDGLRALQAKHDIVGDVRGFGLFIGVDIVKDSLTREPSGRIAEYIKNRMYEHRILIGTEGPKNNVLKVRPPLTIQEIDINMILETMDLILTEAGALLE